MKNHTALNEGSHFDKDSYQKNDLTIKKKYLT